MSAFIWISIVWNSLDAFELAFAALFAALLLLPSLFPRRFRL